MAIAGKKSVGEKVFRVFNTIFLIILCISTLYPFLNVLAVSLSSKGPVSRGEVTFYPMEFTIKAYEKIIESGAIFTAYGNTVFVVVIGTVLSVIMTAFAAYPLSKKHLLGKNIIMFAIALTLWFHAGMIPDFLVVKNLGLLDTLWSLVLAPLISAYNVVIMKTFFQNIPDSLEESARLDGCTDAGVLFRIVLPLSKPVLATIALWVAVGHWNSFMQPLLYLQSREKYTLQLVLRDIVLANTVTEYGMNVDPNNSEFEVVSESVKYGTIIIATVPILMIYPFLQKYFVQGVMIGSIKG